MLGRDGHGSRGGSARRSRAARALDVGRARAAARAAAPAAARGEHRRAAGRRPARAPARTMNRRTSARVGGSSSTSPKTSRDEAGRQQERAAEDHERAVEHLARRRAARGERLVEAPPGRAALRAHQHRPEDRVGDQQRDRPQRADRLPDLDDHVDLRDRDDDEQQDQERACAPTGYGGAACSGECRPARPPRPGSRSRPTSSMSRWICGWAPRSVMRPPAWRSAARDHREVDHQRRVGERQLAQVDEQVAVRGSARESARPPQRLRGAVLVTGAGEDRRVFAERDDARQPTPNVRGLHSAICPQRPNSKRSRTRSRT